MNSDLLYLGRLPPSNDLLEQFLRTRVPASTLDDIEPYFEINVLMPLAQADTFHTYPLTAYNTY